MNLGIIFHKTLTRTTIPVCNFGFVAPQYSDKYMLVTHTELTVLPVQSRPLSVFFFFCDQLPLVGMEA